MMNPADSRHITQDLRFLKLLESHAIMKTVRLKKLRLHYQHRFHDSLAYIDEVDEQTFLKRESNRLPLLIVNRAGLWPKCINYPLFFKEPRTVALLHFAYLSSVVMGFDIYRLPAGWNYKTPFDEGYEEYRVII